MLETTKTTYLNGSSKDGNKVLATFSSSLSESGTMTINETLNESGDLDTVETDFDEFRKLAKTELEKLNAPAWQPATEDNKTDISSDKTEDKEVVATTPDSEPVETTTKVDDKLETAKPDEAKASGVKDSEVKQPVVSDEVKQPVLNEESKEPAASEEPKQPTSTEEIKQPASSEEVKVSDVKDGENVDESNQLRHQ